jgi:hypothetical protein
MMELFTYSTYKIFLAISLLQGCVKTTTPSKNKIKLLQRLRYLPLLLLNHTAYVILTLSTEVLRNSSSMVALKRKRAMELSFLADTCLGESHILLPLLLALRFQET